MTDLLTTSTLGSNVPDPDADCTRTAVGARDFQRPRIGPSVPSGATPLVRRRIKPVPPGPAVTFIPFPDPDDAEPADDWDRRADRLQWWMADLGGPHPVTVETTENPVGASRTLEHTLRRFGVDVIEANETLIKGLLRRRRNERWFECSGGPSVGPTRGWRWSKFASSRLVPTAG